MFRNYLLTAYKVFMRRKLFTAINLVCIVLTLVVLMVITAFIEHSFFPSGVEGKSARFLQVMAIKSTSPDGHNSNVSPLGYKVIERYLKPMQSVELVAAVTMPRTVSVYQDGRVSELQMRRADANYWKVLDFTLRAGRLPDANDDRDARMVAVLNVSTANKLFPGMPALDQTISVAGQQLRIIGVVEDELHLNAFADLWTPISSSPSSDYRLELRGEFIALLLAKSTADLPQIRQEVEQIAQSVELHDPTKWNKVTFWADSKLELFARMSQGKHDGADSGSATVITIVVVAMLLFMLLPALNLVNLNSGRISERSAEIGVRRAFGATRPQLAGQLVVENVLLCLAGGVLGLLCSQLVLMWIEASGVIPYLKLNMNIAVMGYGLLITLVFGLLSGVLPAWKMASLDPVDALKGTA